MVGIIELKDAKPGDTVEFRASGKPGSADFYLRPILKWFEPSYDGYGWHLAILVQYDIVNGWTILEAVWPRVKITLLNSKKGEFRIWRLTDKTLDSSITDAYVKDHLKAPYDVLVYVWTILWALLKKYLHVRIPYIVNMRWDCWELWRWYHVWHGVQLIPDSHYPLITDLCQYVKKRNRLIFSEKN